MNAPPPPPPHPLYHEAYLPAPLPAAASTALSGQIPHADRGETHAAATGEMPANMQQSHNNAVNIPPHQPGALNSTGAAPSGHKKAPVNVSPHHAAYPHHQYLHPAASLPKMPRLPEETQNGGAYYSMNVPHTVHGLVQSKSCSRLPSMVQSNQGPLSIQIPSLAASPVLQRKTPSAPTSPKHLRSSPMDSPSSSHARSSNSSPHHLPHPHAQHGVSFSASRVGTAMHRVSSAPMMYDLHVPEKSVTEQRAHSPTHPKTQHGKAKTTQV